MLQSEVLEENGLSEMEYRTLCMIIERPRLPSHRIMGPLRLGGKRLMEITKNLSDQGLIRSQDKGEKTHFIPTEKGRATKREITNVIKAARGIEEQPDAPDVPAITEEQGRLLGNLIEIGNIIEVSAQLCRLNHDWLRVVAILRGMGEALTPAEILAYMDPPSGELEVLEMKLAKKVNGKGPAEMNWIEVVEGDGGVAAYQITKAGADAIDLIMEDLKERLKGE